MKKITWWTDDRDKQLMKEIMFRFTVDFGRELGCKKLVQIELDIMDVHLNGCRLDLEKLLKFDAFSFHHDIMGIRQNINRKNGKLKNFFIPRCAYRLDDTIKQKKSGRKKEAGK